MGIGDAERMAVVQGIGYVENMIPVIELQGVMWIHPVVASGREPDFIRMHSPFIPRIIKRLDVNERR